MCNFFNQEKHLYLFIIVKEKKPHLLLCVRRSKEFSFIRVIILLYLLDSRTFHVIYHHDKLFEILLFFFVRKLHTIITNQLNSQHHEMVF